MLNYKDLAARVHRKKLSCYIKNEKFAFNLWVLKIKIISIIGCQLQKRLNHFSVYIVTWVLLVYLSRSCFNVKKQKNNWIICGFNVYFSSFSLYLLFSKTIISVLFLLSLPHSILLWHSWDSLFILKRYEMNLTILLFYFNSLAIIITAQAAKVGF